MAQVGEGVPPLRQARLCRGGKTLRHGAGGVRGAEAGRGTEELEAGLTSIVTPDLIRVHDFNAAMDAGSSPGCRWSVNDRKRPIPPGTGRGTTEGGGGARAGSRYVQRTGTTSRTRPPFFAWATSPVGEERPLPTPHTTTSHNKHPQ